LNRQQRLHYIFPNRIGWFDALLSDIRTVITGGQHYKNKSSDYLGGTYGAGNVSIAELICTGLELAAAHYTGKTTYNTNKKKKTKQLPTTSLTSKKPKQSGYNATANVQTFVVEYFPTNMSKEISHILWDAIRNGTHHLFTPKSIKYRNSTVKIMFYVEKSTIHSNVTRIGNIIQININCIEFYRVLKKAFKDYKRDLETKRILQINFIKASKSIENSSVLKSRSDISREVNYLSKRLKQTGIIKLFK